jgi:hypothetical protein
VKRPVLINKVKSTIKEGVTPNFVDLINVLKEIKLDDPNSSLNATQMTVNGKTIEY